MTKYDKAFTALPVERCATSNLVSETYCLDMDPQGKRTVCCQSRRQALPRLTVLGYQVEGKIGEEEGGGKVDEGGDIMDHSVYCHAIILFLPLSPTPTLSILSSYFEGLYSFR
jgi:hypothetical protein